MRLKFPSRLLVEIKDWNVKVVVIIEIVIESTCCGWFRIYKVTKKNKHEQVLSSPPLTFMNPNSSKSFDPRFCSANLKPETIISMRKIIFSA